MPKLSDIEIDLERFKGKGLRPWSDVQNNNKTKNQKTIFKNIETKAVDDQKRMTKGCQKDDKGVSKGCQKDVKRVSKGCQKDDKRGTKKMTKGCQKDDNQNTSKISLFSLIGKQKECVLLISELIQKAQDKASFPVNLDYFCEKLHSSKNSIKKTLGRLKEKKVLYTTENRIGRGGWVRYSLDDSIYQETLENDRINKWMTKGCQKDDKRGTKRMTNVLSSSSNILNTTTNWDEQILDSIDISLLEKIKFTKSHLKQFCTVKDLTPEIIQHSINHFAYDLEHNAKEKEIKKSPLAYFMGIMKRNGCYNAPDNYESSQDKAIREWVEKEEKQKKLREEQRMKIFNLAFDKWLDSLTEDEAREIFRNENPHSKIPFKGKGDSGFSQAMLRNYYRKKIWINERKELGLDGFWDHFNDDETQ